VRVLGISAFYHDSAAALVEDGRVVAAAQEERFTRIAYLGRAPRATKWLAWLTVAGLMIQYVTAGLRSSPSLLTWAALHAVSALLLAWTAIELARHATRLARERVERELPSAGHPGRSGGSP
jgi:hypothetical protein